MNSNAYWYIGLALLSIALLIYVCIKKNTTRSLLLFLAIVGTAYLIETVIYNFLWCYQYYPRIIKDNIIYDSHLGAMSSNAFSLPVVAVFIAAFRINWLGITLFTCLFVGIEWLFLELHIYTHHWWRLGYTALGLPFYFITAKAIYRRIGHPMKGILHSILLFLIISPISASLNFTPIMIFENREYLPHWFVNHAKDTTAFAAVYYLSMSLLHVIVTLINWRSHWLKYAVTATIVYVITIILIERNILHSHIWWDKGYYVLISVIVLRVTVVLSRRISA